MYKHIFKRFIDILFSVVILILAMPILILVAIIIKCESKGPVIFRQNRIGLNGNVFEIYKFRSMVVGAEKTGSGVYSEQGDSRVTKTGKIIRALSIDEFPQFVNIIKGDMSLIGPRPTLTYHPWSFEEYTSAQQKRFNVRPGITGWAQINGRKGLDWNKRIEYDIEYIENLSFSLDVTIFFKTIVKIFMMKDNQNIGKTVSTSNTKEKVLK